MTTLRSKILLAFTLAFLVVAPWLTSSAEARAPLTLGEVVQLMEGGVTSGRVKGLISELGVSFELDVAAQRRLKAAGASDDILHTVVASYRGPEPAEASPPSPEPTASPSPAPTAAPSPEPTASPSPKPTQSPAARPTLSPTPRPTPSPSTRPTSSPRPTASPSPAPTATSPAPTASPTPKPTPPPTPETKAPATPEPTPPATATLIVRSNIAEDRVWIDGRDMGPSGPDGHEIAVGKHVVEVRTKLATEKQEVDLESGETRTLRFNFVRSTPSPSPAVRDTTTRWSPGSGRCRNLDDCISFAQRGLDRAKCGGELTVSFQNSCDEPIVAKVCSQGTDGSASCQFIHAASKSKGGGRFCESSGRYLWAARNIDSPGGACWPNRLKEGAKLTAEVSTGGRCTILDHCLEFTNRALDPYECGGKLTLDYRNTCSTPVMTMLCGRRNDGTQPCGRIAEIPAGGSGTESFCDSTGAYKFAARSLGDSGEGCWPVGFVAASAGE